MDEHVSETDNDENAFNVVRTSSRTTRDTPLRDITDQFFHPPSPSPVRRPPPRPKKPKSLAYPADPPNWLYAPSSSSLPPSSPFPPSDHHLATPSKASDSDPFGFVAVERALKAKRATALKSPPRSTVLPSALFASFSQLDEPVPTNNEDIEGLYADEPVAGPSHVHRPVAPLLMMNSDQPLAPSHSQQPTSPDPLRTPRKRKRRASPISSVDPDPDEQVSDTPSSPSPVKISLGAGTHRPPRASRIPVPKLTRAHTRTVGTTTRPKRVKTSYQRIPTPASTHPSSRQSTAHPTPVPPRRSKRQAAADARVKLSGTSDTEEGGRMRLRPRTARASTETKTTKPTTRTKQPSSKSKAPTKTQKATTTAKAARGRPKTRLVTKGTKGKGKARPLESVLDLSDDTREKYEKERRERLEYFKRLEGYQIQKENVYVV